MQYPRLAGFEGPLLVPSTGELNCAYRAQATSGFPLDTIIKYFRADGYLVARRSYQTSDGHLWFWGLQVVLTTRAEVAILFPWVDEPRPTAAYIRGEVPTPLIEFVILGVQQCLLAAAKEAAPSPVVVTIRLRE